MNRTIITVVGKDTVGIIAKVCTYLAENIADKGRGLPHGFRRLRLSLAPGF